MGYLRFLLRVWVLFLTTIWISRSDGSWLGEATESEDELGTDLSIIPRGPVPKDRDWLVPRWLGWFWLFWWGLSRV